MERDLNNDDFELFLKQKVDQHKLFPSDKAWKGIYNSLHPGMKWVKIGGSLLVVTALIFIFQETSFLSSPNASIKSNSLGNSSSIETSNKTASLQPFNNKQPQTGKISAGASSLQKTSASKSVLVENSKLSQPSDDSPEEIVSMPVNNNKEEAIHNLHGFMLHQNAVLGQNFSINIAIPHNEAIKQNEQKDIVADKEIVEDKDITGSNVTINSIAGDSEFSSVGDLNWLQELAAIKLSPQKKSKFNLQFYFSPTISYRRLVDNQNASRANLLNIPVAASRDQNINKYVDQNASIGAELGSNILFSASRNLTIKSGLQLNYSRYTIKAFKFYTEKASIALNTAGPVADTISSYTSLRNFNGYFPEQLQNQYLQVSIPVGAELKLIGNKRLQFSIAGTVQPTFLLFSDTYLLSSNYLNYTKEPSLVRKWNVHTSFESFLSYKIGGLRWQLGPQFRYQLMSSYNDRYPIREYLFEYGFKIGVSKTLR